MFKKKNKKQKKIKQKNKKQKKNKQKNKKQKKIKQKNKKQKKIKQKNKKQKKIKQKNKKQKKIKQKKRCYMMPREGWAYTTLFTVHCLGFTTKDVSAKFRFYLKSTLHSNGLSVVLSVLANC